MPQRSRTAQSGLGTLPGKLAWGCCPLVAGGSDRGGPAPPRALSEARPSRRVSDLRVRSPRAPSQVCVVWTAGAGGCLQGTLLALRLGLETCVSRARRCFWLVVRRLASHVHGPTRYFQVFTESDCHCLIDGPGDELYVKHALSACEIKAHPLLWGRSVSSLGSYVFLTRRFLALPPPVWVWAGAQDHLVLLHHASSPGGTHKGPPSSSSAR